MNRFTGLNAFQKALLILLAAMIPVFTVLYALFASKEGFRYRNEFLQAREENGATVYAGKIDGRETSFTVNADRSVLFRIGSKVYGPYTAVLDPSAVPQNTDFTAEMTGIELRCGDRVVFRGGEIETGEDWLYLSEDENQNISIQTDSVAIIQITDGSVIDGDEPPAGAILNLMNGRALTQKGDWSFWLYGTGICALTALILLFADELFRFGLRFQIRDSDKAEPSGWELARRYFLWSAFTIIALVLFLTGLR